MRVTIKDIAQKAGVSIAAVSKALNNQQGVSAHTRKKILKISRNLGYTPNALARNLVKKKNNTLGIFIPDISTPTYAAIYKGINEAAKRCGYVLLLCDTNRSREYEETYIQTMMENRVAGLLVCPVDNDISHFKDGIKGQVPIVYFGGKVHDGMDNYVGIDNRKGAEIAVKHLIEHGHRDILMVCDNKSTKTKLDRMEGYQSAMRKAGLSPRDVLLGQGMRGRDCGYRLMKSFYGHGENQPSAIFAVNDEIAIGIMEFLVEQGRSIPADISIIGFDDIPYASLPMINLSSIWQPKFRIGEMAVNMIDDILKGHCPDSGTQIILTPELKARKSVKDIRVE